ncbi:MFS transporter [Algoriphagus pacificus]|uniref:MFS transporter n=1 Tax=Algoriphagus pacificus TaxID=2811234 RepID=A0ABS3CGK1_9BACT|nr:MFS transporter [Algoriphagus pacificus]MBN7816213.1 MFS transporter [Algoriphagus pacificus]
MKKRLLLIVIYLAFISLGLPDSLLGAGWPSMYKSLGTPIHFAGIISMIVAGGTVISSLFSARFINRFGVAKITAFSVFLTAISLFGFAYSDQFIFLCLLAVPLGLGAGCVDVALNNYVALHYQAKHMNWLHCFWGVGAAIGPMLMAGYLAQGKSWESGYHTVALIQFGLVLILVLSFPLWIKKEENANEANETSSSKSFKRILAIPGLKSALLLFFCYCTIEATFGLWAASYLVFVREFKVEDAAQLVSLYYGGITIGRFLSGFISLKLSNQNLVKAGQGLILLGLVLLFLPTEFTIIPGILLVGLGCAPIFPSLLHETPRNFGEKDSESIMGMQMASAYVGITIMPLIFGKLAGQIGFESFIGFLGLILLLKVFLTYDMNVRVSKRKKSIEGK